MKKFSPQTYHPEHREGPASPVLSPSRDQTRRLNHRSEARPPFATSTLPGLNKTGKKPKSSSPVRSKEDCYAVVFVQYVSNARVNSCAIAGAVELSIADRCIRYTSCPSRSNAIAGDVGG